MSERKTNLKNATIQGAMWVYISTYSAKLLVFLSTAILARLLTQEDFGVAGYALVFMSFLEILQGLGIRQALIYYRPNPERLNTAFWLGIGIGVGLYVITWLLAPVAGWFFNDPRAVEVTRALGLSIPISSLTLVHQALLHKDLAFKKQVTPQLGHSLCKGMISIVLALLGFGYWSLILGHVGGAIVRAVLYWWTIPWRPSLRFETDNVRPLLSYGSKISLNDGLSIILNNLDYFLIGRFLGAAALGVYSLAFRIPELLINQFSRVIGDVTFPVFTKMEVDRETSLRRGFLATVQYSNMIVFPLGVGLALVAEPFVLVAFTEKWAEAIPVTRAIALFATFRASVFNAGVVYKVQGRPGLLARIQLWQAAVAVPALLWAVSSGQVAVVAWTQAGLAFLLMCVQFIIASRVLQISILAILSALRPALTGVAVMAVVVIGVLQLSDIPLLQLITAVISGALVYVATLWLLHQSLVQEARYSLLGALNRK
jgi:O-antigen/teichoic acid export membrane protein